METEWNRWMQKSVKIIKGLIIAYLVTGIGLLFLAFLLLKLQIGEEKIALGILLIYVLSGFAGGFFLGKRSETKRFFWGMVLGIIYWMILIGITLLSGNGLQNGGKGLFLNFVICVGAGMIGAMISGA